MSQAFILMSYNTDHMSVHRKIKHIHWNTISVQVHYNCLAYEQIGDFKELLSVEHHHLVTPKDLLYLRTKIKFVCLVLITLLSLRIR